MARRAVLQLHTQYSYLFALILLLASPMGFSLPSSRECAVVTDDYLAKHHKEAVPWTGDNMVYFLHVPRTAGRTFHACMLKLGTHPDKRCPKAYDHLRVNMSDPHCLLLSSHDDFSIVSMLPENTAVLTHVRDPVDRFLSAYEFGVEISARQAAKGPQKKKNMNAMSTEDVWPWSYLIPYFADSTRNRVLMADGLASGHLIWVISCNSFDGQPDLSVTAVGARRGLLLGVPGVEEDVGMIGIHYNGDFIELVPWTGDVSWDVAPWGKWTIRASSRDYDALIEASCPADAGAVLRAEMMEPFKTMIQAPIDIAALAALVPKDFQPPGL
eukprot:gene22637-29780_t